MSINKNNSTFKDILNVSVLQSKNHKRLSTFNQPLSMTPEISKDDIKRDKFTFTNIELDKQKQSRVSNSPQIGNINKFYFIKSVYICAVINT